MMIYLLKKIKYEQRWIFQFATLNNQRIPISTCSSSGPPPLGTASWVSDVRHQACAAPITTVWANIRIPSYNTSADICLSIQFYLILSTLLSDLIIPYLSIYMSRSFNNLARLVLASTVTVIHGLGSRALERGDAHHHFPHEMAMKWQWRGFRKLLLLLQFGGTPPFGDGN